MINQNEVRRQFGDMFQKYFPGQNQNKMFDEEAVKMGYGGQDIEQSQLDDYFRQRIGAGSPVTVERSAPQIPITPERSAPQIPNYVAPPPIMERSAPQVPISMQPSTPQTPISSMAQPMQPQAQPQVKPAQTNWLSPSPSVMSQHSNRPVSPMNPSSQSPDPGADTSMSNQLMSSVRKPGLQNLPSWFK